MDLHLSARELGVVNSLLEGRLGSADGSTTGTLVVSAPPGSGKTRFALALLLEALRRLGDTEAVMAVSGRQTADELGDTVIRSLGSTSQARPVTTLSAIAFRLLSRVRGESGKPLPRLLNGAEQEALLRHVVAQHIHHARVGDECGTCMLLRGYFAVSRWAPMIREAGLDTGTSSGGNPPAGTTEALFERGISDAFIVQLRDMIARMNELGASHSNEQAILASLGALDSRTGRLDVQWRLAFALREEYAQAIRQEYPDEFRLDSSRLLVEGTEAVRQADDDALPRLVVVDDFQDLTLAGLSFLSSLAVRGIGLALVGNPDESVQTFRGSYPEYLFEQVSHRPFAAHEFRLSGDEDPPALGSAAPQARTYLDLVRARVSLSIQSLDRTDVALPLRPGKLPAFPGSLPIRALDDGDALSSDASVGSAMYRSSREELDDTVWHIKREHLAQHRQWNDMAVIAHDNATVRMFGERLRRDGVPVRYSSVTKALKDEPFVQGLFAITELAQLRNRGISACAGRLGSVAASVRSRVSTLISGPLINAARDAGQEFPARLAPVESAMRALGSLETVLETAADTGGETALADPRAHLSRLARQWRAISSRAARSRSNDTGMEVDDTLVADAPADSAYAMRFGMDAMYVMLAFGAGLARGSGGAEDDSVAATLADDVLAAIRSVCGEGPQINAFAQLWELVDKVAQGLEALPTQEPKYVLWLAWDATGAAERWQRQALMNTPAGRAANDRLDVAMRLFDYASATGASRDMRGFIEQVRAMRIEADSLAKVAPVDQAVTLTTPAGAAGEHWPLVWIPAVQQGIWPNLALRNTLFGGDELAAVMLHGGLAHADGREGDAPLTAVLTAEQKSLLVALTRAGQRMRISAVYNDDATPSDFLYAYLPERFDRRTDADAAKRRYTQVADADAFAGLDADPRGIVTAARVVLAGTPADSAEEQDAASALALLAQHGVDAADPANWPYVQDGQVSAGLGPDGQEEGDLRHGGARDEGASATRPAQVTLSPSAVDQIWACPVCWMLENRFAGPRPSSVSTGFGSLIHEVARRASEEGLDLPGAMQEHTPDRRVAQIGARMMELYETLRSDTGTIDDPEERYRAMRKDADAERMLGAIADYFVASNTARYPAKNTEKFEVGILKQAQCELEFHSVFDMRDILAAYNSIEGVQALELGELYALMGVLVGGWPPSMREDLTVRLSGRIDRKETRIRADGAEQVRLIDYKTGKPPAMKQIFNDLQLVCYQLGLAFAEGGPRGAQALAGMPNISQCALFHVADKSAPAESTGAESLFQPALFESGHLNASAMTIRAGFRNGSRLLDLEAFPDTPPAGVGSVAWQQFLGLRGTQAPWALTMIARVFYTAGASICDHLIAHPQPWHVGFCRMKQVCPACAGHIDTVFEMRKA